MILRKAVLFVAAVALVTATSAHAQFGVYGMFTADRLSNSASSPLPLPPNSTGSAFARANTVDPLGGTGGVYYDFMKLGPVRLGADVRGSILTTKRGAYTNFNGPGAHIYSVLGGVRGVFHTPVNSLKPYLQISAGLGRSDYGLYTGRPASNQPRPNVLYTNFQYQELAGLDIKLLPIMDWRVDRVCFDGPAAFCSFRHQSPHQQRYQP